MASYDIKRYIGEAESWERITTGLSNVVFKVLVKKVYYVLKIMKSPYIDYTPRIFPVDVIDEGTDYRIEKYIENFGYDTADEKEKIACAMRKVHNYTPEIKMRRFDDLLKERVKRISENMHSNIVSQLENICEKFIKALACKNLKMCHNDLQPGNVLKIESGMFIIDWEYCTMNNPLFDIANFFCEASTNYKTGEFDTSIGWDEEGKKEFLDYYFENKKYDHNVLKKIEALENVSHFFWFLWGLNMFERSDEGFDYYKYTLSRLKELEKCSFINVSEYNLLLAVLNLKLKLCKPV